MRAGRITVPLSGGEAAQCSLVYEEFKLRAFGGDFEKLHAWWLSQRVARQTTSAQLRQSRRVRDDTPLPWSLCIEHPAICPDTMAALFARIQVQRSSRPWMHVLVIDWRMEVVIKNTICLWYDGTALDAARFYAETFPDSAVGAIIVRPATIPLASRATS